MRRLLMTTDAVGGVWTYALQLSAALAAHDVEVVLATLGPSPAASQRAAAGALPNVELIDTGLPLEWLADDPQAMAQAGEAVLSLAARRKADLLQVNTPALVVHAANDVPVVAVAHSCVATWWAAVRGGAMPTDFEWRTAQMRTGLTNADAVVAPSEAFAAALEQVYRLARPVHAVRNGRTPFVLPVRDTARFAFTAGRLWDEGKGLRTIDRMAALLECPVRAAGPLAGPNGSRVALDHTHWLGPLDDAGMAWWLAARPVFVSAARYEPFGLSVLEAAQAGCPLVLSDIPTFRELWDGAASFVAPEDHEAFAHEVSRLWNSREKSYERSTTAFARSLHLTPAAMAEGMMRVYAAAQRAWSISRRQIGVAA